MESADGTLAQAVIYVSTDEPTPVNFTVETNSPFVASPTSGIATYGRTTPVYFSTGASSRNTPAGDDITVKVGRTSRGTDQTEKTIRVKAEGEKKITVIGLNNVQVSADAFLALPCQSYNGVTGKTPYEYFIFSGDQVQRPSETLPEYRSAFLIVTCQDDTNININPSNTAFVRGTARGTTVAGGGSHTMTEAARQTILVVDPSTGANVDLTGTIVTSDKPISIFAGHQCGRVPGNREACDHLIEQMPPHMVWGTTFFAVPLARRRSGDRFRVGAIRDNTVINVTCTTPGSSVPSITSVTRNRSPTPAGNNYYEFDTGPPSRDLNFQADYCCIETNYPVSVMQYSKGFTVDMIPGQYGDPFMLLVPPIEQSLDNFTLTTFSGTLDTSLSANDFQSNMSIAISAEFFNNSAADQAKVQLNGNQVTPPSGSWTPIYCHNGLICGYGAQTPLSDTRDSTLVLNDPSGGMNAYVYGFAVEGSYGYPGGFQMEPIGCKLKCCSSK